MAELGANRGLSANVTEHDLRSPIYQMFEKPNYEMVQTNGTETVFTASNIDTDGPYTFQINANPFQYIQTNKMLLEMEFNIKKDDANLATTDIVAPVNSILTSVFDYASVALKKEPISELTQELLPYKAYLETLLSYNPEGLQSNVSSTGFQMDTPGKFDVATKATDGDAQNKGHNERMKWTATSKTCQVIGRLPIDCFQIDGLFPPGIPIDITLYKSKTNFHLMSTSTNNATDKFHLNITKLKLHVNYIDLSEKYRSQHLTYWDKMPFSLHFSKVNIKSKQFSNGMTELNFDNCFNGILPKTVVCVMVDSASLDGKINKNPFNFKHNSLSQIYLRVNNATIPSEPIQCDFSKSLTKRAYQYFLDNTGQGYQCQSGSPVYHNYYEKGCTIFAFDLTPDKCNGFHLHPHEKGNLDVKIKLSAGLTTGVTLLVLGTFDQFLMIPKDKQAYIEYA